MGRLCNGLLTTFRVVQYLSSIITLGCGAYITYELYSISGSAHLLETSITAALQNGTSNGISLDEDVEDGLYTLASLMIHVLHFLEGTPVRAIILSVVGSWSIVVITYLFFAQKSKIHLNASKRSIRVSLELATLLAWIVAITCSILLTLEYGIVVVACGSEAKSAIELCTSILQEVLQQTHSGKNISAALNIVNDVITMGALSITSVIASGFCWMTSFVSLMVACCMSGKRSELDPAREASSSMIANLSWTGYVGKPAMHVSETGSPGPSPTILAMRY